MLLLIHGMAGNINARPPAAGKASQQRCLVAAAVAGADLEHLLRAIQAQPRR